MRPIQSQRGFTLLELLIAITVFAVMATMAYGGLSSVIQTRETVSAALDRSKGLQIALWRIHSDVEQIVDRPIRDSFGDRRPPILASPTYGFQFTRSGWSNPLGEARSTLERVGYRIDDQNNLVRFHWRALDQAQDSQPVETVLLQHVSDMEWRFLDHQHQWQGRWPPNGSVNGLSSTQAQAQGAQARDEEGNGKQTFTPPLAIELRLDTKTWGRLKLDFTVPGARR